jgi:hypothetical protein
MKDLFSILSSLEKDEHIHLGRLLVLVYVFSGEKHKGEIEGLTKLAKLDFLLRYPTYLERALQHSHKKMIKSPPKDYEKTSVEAKMVRFRYGPWDFRYRRFINTLVGMGQLYLRREGRSYYLGITEEGIQTAGTLVLAEDLRDIVERSRTIKTNFDYSGTNLMKFIYSIFPEIVSLQYGKEIV